MICIGLDLATKRTGCCVMDGDKLVHYECISVNPKEEFRTRIRKIGLQVDVIFKKFSPDIAFIEDAPIIKNSSASMLCTLQGYILRIADEQSIPFEVFQPSSWRKTLGIVGKNGKDALKKENVKQATVDYVNKRFGLDLIYKKNSVKSQDDIADSIGIACCGIARGQNG